MKIGVEGRRDEGMKGERDGREVCYPAGICHTTLRL
jgi:hypothetical protein